MGGSMSSSSLYRTVAIVEVVTSVVVASFGVNTFLLFQQQPDKFQTDKEMIFYSSIVAVVQSFLAVLSSVLLVGCQDDRPLLVHHRPPAHSTDVEGNNGEQRSSLPPLPKGVPQIGPHSLRRKAMAPTWISWTFISIACLLFVFIAPIHYCIQTDAEREGKFTLPDNYKGELVDLKRGLCQSTSPEMEPIRNALRDLYSFSLISVMFKVIFVIMVYRNWKAAQERAKKVIIYVEETRRQQEQAAGDYNYEGDYDPRSTPTEPKIIISSCSTGAGLSGVESDELVKK